MKKTSGLRRCAAAWALSLSLLAPVAAEATVVVPLSRAELVAQSDVVVRATVVGATSRWNETHTQIITLTRLHVTETLKGANVASELVLRQFGGEVDGLVSHVSGDARLVAGQDAVFFLRGGNGVVYLTALAQAVYYVQAPTGGAPVAQRNLSGLTFAATASGTAVNTFYEPAPEAAEGLAQLRASVQQAVRGGR